MKKSFNNSYKELNSAELIGLTTEVKERIATGNFEQVNKSFTTADLWNIQRNSKNRLQRRFL
jgi:hypothetical protein